jgi:hypothetical protein
MVPIGVEKVSFRSYSMPAYPKYIRVFMAITLVFPSELLQLVFTMASIYRSLMFWALSCAGLCSPLGSPLFRRFLVRVFRDREARNTEPPPSPSQQSLRLTRLLEV